MTSPRIARLGLGVLGLVAGCDAPCAHSPDVVVVLDGAGRPFTAAKQLLIELAVDGGALQSFGLLLKAPLQPGGTVLLEPKPAPAAATYALDVTITSRTDDTPPQALGRGIAHATADAAACNRIPLLLAPIDDADLGGGG